jgi:hypothetical protein
MGLSDCSRQRTAHLDPVCRRARAPATKTERRTLPGARCIRPWIGNTLCSGPSGGRWQASLSRTFRVLRCWTSRPLRCVRRPTTWEAYKIALAGPRGGLCNEFPKITFVILIISSTHSSRTCCCRTSISVAMPTRQALRLAFGGRLRPWLSIGSGSEAGTERFRRQERAKGNK